MKEREKKCKNTSSPAVAVVLANIRREIRITALFPHEFSTPSVFARPHDYPPERAHVRAHVTTYMPACICCMYTYVLGARGERTRSLSGELYEKKDGEMRERQRRRRRYRSGRRRLRERRDTIRGLRKKGRRKGRLCWRRDTGMLVTSPSWSSQWALGQPDRRGMKARRAPTREKGVRISR